MPTAGQPPRSKTKRGKMRPKVLHAIGATRHHYQFLRFLSQAMSLGILAVVPAAGLARVDFWGGEHRLLFEPASIKHTLAGVILGIAGMYVVTFLSNVVAGRLFCGWGCPVGQVSRFGDAVEEPGLSRGRRALRHAGAALYSAVFVLAVLYWWADLRMLVLGSPRAMAIGWALVTFGTVGAYLHGRVWRWNFCKSVCPIGLYYSFVAPARYFGIHFRNQQRTCIECDACDHVCPVDLHPRTLAEPVSDRVGITIADAPGFNHCLECGDCIVACQFMVARKGTPREAAPLRLGYFAGSQHIDAASGSPTSPTDQTTART